jgi:pimeloyl-ACP methyl ester carboxylesterase
MHVSLLELLFRFGRHRLLFLLLRRKDMDQKIRSIEQLPGCDVAGPRDAFPIVLVHGSASTRNMWVPQMETFSDEFLVIAVDLPGHGALREQPFRLEAAIQAVMESLRHQSHDRALIVGLSLGGYIAMACAHEHPQEIAGLVLSGCCIDYRGALGFLIVNGENDKPNRKREAVLLRATQDGQLQIIKQAGHLCNLEQPEAFTFQVRTFAKRLSEETRRGAFV